MTGATPKQNARAAGILYVLLGVIAPVRLIYIPNAVLVAGNPQATAANIASHEATFRVAIVTDVLAGTLTLFVALAPSYLAGFDQQQREGLVSLFLRLHTYGVTMNEML